MLYGSQFIVALMPYSARSHQLGEGQRRPTAMSRGLHPPQLVYGSQSNDTEMSLPIRSHQFTRGHQRYAAMPAEVRLAREGSVLPRSSAKNNTPFPPVREVSREQHKDVIIEAHLHQLGKGQ